MTPRITAWARLGAVVGAVVALDQVTKAGAVASLALGESVNVFYGLDLTHVRNTGVAFGALAGGGALVLGLVGLAIALLVAYFSLRATLPGLWLPVGLLLGGALGNLVDRAREGTVIDFIDPIAWPAFNVADICVVVGVLGLFYVTEGPNNRQATPGRAGARPERATRSPHSPAAETPPGSIGSGGRSEPDNPSR
ncbi:MAG TPA: signal peptidase II [Thermoleophilaceae bacterium]|nr:signal peptidase II [Thermoleophilaceae bacterium]